MINNKFFIPAGEELCDLRANIVAESEKIDDKNLRTVIANSVAECCQRFNEKNGRHFENYVIH
jgi:hypothetical protein